MTVTATLVGGPGPGTTTTTTSAPSTSATATTTAPPTSAPTTVSPISAATGLTEETAPLPRVSSSAVTECLHGDAVTLVDVEPLEGFTGGFTILLDVGGTTMLFVYEPDTGTITEGDRASADLIAECGVL